MELKLRTPSTVGNPDNRNNHLVSTFLLPQELKLIIRAKASSIQRGEDTTAQQHFSAQLP